MQPRSIRGVVRGGRLRVDVPTSLPAGAEVELVALEDEVSSEEQRRLDAAIERGLDDHAQGRTRPVREFLAQRKPLP
jgi:hypothetical protein